MHAAGDGDRWPVFKQDLTGVSPVCYITMFPILSISDLLISNFINDFAYTQIKCKDLFI